MLSSTSGSNECDNTLRVMRECPIDQGSQGMRFSAGRIGGIDHDVDEPRDGVVQIKLWGAIFLEGIMVLAILFAVRVIEGAQTRVETINFVGLIEVQYRGKVIKLLQDLHELVGIGLRVIVASRQSEVIQPFVGGIEDAGALRLEFRQGIPALFGGGQVLDLGARIPFTAGFHHDADLILSLRPGLDLGFGDSVADHRFNMISIDVAP